MAKAMTESNSDRVNLWLVFTGILVGAALLGNVGCRRKPTVIPTGHQRANQPTKTTAAADSADTAYHNLATDAQYAPVGSCAECHAELAERYAQHPMGNSLTLLQPETLGPWKQRDAKFQSGAFHYSVRATDDGLTHRRWLSPESDTSASPDTATTDNTTARVPPVDEHFTPTILVGSGQRGQSFLLSHAQPQHASTDTAQLVANDASTDTAPYVASDASTGTAQLIASDAASSCLRMSPLTWYPQKQRWDLSPGYEHNDLGFTRPVQEDCLFCHANRVQLVSHTKSRYHLPLFQGEAIDCQRCHGPGQQHVDHHRAGKPVAGIDQTIVNPAHLSPPLREAVCQQCHFVGAARIVQQGKQLSDFRPGQPLDNVLATFALSPNPAHADTDHFVGQVEQMMASRCYEASDGALGCISCHDPHGRPSDEHKILFYVGRCMRCHDDNDCAQPQAKRLDDQAVDNCLRCHMPKMETDVRHTSSTDHRIPRLADPTATAAPPSQHPYAIYPFPPRVSQESSVRADRNLALGLLNAAQYHPQRVTPFQLKKMIGPLRQAIVHDRADLDAAEGLAEVLQQIAGQGGRELYEQVLEAEPQREHALVKLAELEMKTGHPLKALSLWQRALQINPWSAAYTERFAAAHMQAEQWQDAFGAAEQGLKRFPSSVGLRQIHVDSAVRLNRRPVAEQSFKILLQLMPGREAEMRKWYQGLETSPLAP